MQKERLGRYDLILEVAVDIIPNLYEEHSTTISISEERKKYKKRKTIFTQVGFVDDI